MPEDTGQLEGWVFSPPCAEDGLKVNRLVANCPPLDRNSVYCNLLQCHHFAGTSVKVETQERGNNGQLLGFISGYLVPGDNSRLFIWQVAVAEAARGHNLGVRMMQNLLTRPVCDQVRYIETTITPDNQASWAMFKKLAKTLRCGHGSALLFETHLHFGGQHKDEMLVSVGPFKPGIDQANSD